MAEEQPHSGNGQEEPCEITPEVTRILFYASEIIGEDLFDSVRPAPDMYAWIEAASRPQLCGVLRKVLNQLNSPAQGTQA